MTELIIFKIFVRPSPKCMAVLRYLDKNIETVNRLGAGVRIENIGSDEIDESIIDLFRKKGITRLPAALSPDGKVFIGLQQITTVFDNNIKRGRNSRRVSPITGDYDDFGGSASTDLDDFYARQMFSRPDKNGKRVPLQDKDEREDTGADLERRMAEYRRRPPAHRTPDAQRERNIDMPTRERRVVRRDDSGIPEDEDNIADYIRDDDSPPRSAPRRGRAPTVEPSGNAAEDELDNRILAAFMDKSPNGTDF